MFLITFFIMGSISIGAQSSDITTQLNSFLENGDMDVLISVTHQMSLSEISERLKSMPRRVTAIGEGRVTNPFDGDWGYDCLHQMVMDSKGVLHVVFSKQREVGEHGQDIQRECTLFYVKKQGDKWSEPVALPDCGLYPTQLLLLADCNDGLWLLGSGARLDEFPRSVSENLVLSS